MNKLFYVFIFLFLLLACAKKYVADALPQKQLHFGVGGGFTGKETDYVLLENGQVFMKEPFEKTYKELGKIKSKEAKAYFSQVSTYGRAKVNAPSNAYSFIEMQTDSVTKHKMVFSDGMKKDSLIQSLLLLHESMLKAVPTETIGRKKQAVE
jgi:hypothetical protein